MLVGILKRYWQEIAVGVLIVLLAIWIGSLKFALGSARGDIAQQKGEIAELQSANAILAEKAEKQNAEVAALHAESEKKRQAGIRALADAKKRAAAAQRQADWLAEQLAKPSSGKNCGDAFRAWRNH